MRKREFTSLSVRKEKRIQFLSSRKETDFFFNEFGKNNFIGKSAKFMFICHCESFEHVLTWCFPISEPTTVALLEIRLLPLSNPIIPLFKGVFLAMEVKD